ncbi:phosphate metabolism protein 7 [Malassezia pachydermatis]|uniref:DUF221-domain-containing protein n=1 Tax=Malassezia pachydermatis TaxID=77020 RepID=A0A0N0RSB9_9BASI|nr:hypothetical protein Malapachy_3974 [Malassezia pachydermatis]KOS14329.1 hypothetical protein Malapachy_3974 [Malassezia pachydermatis]
MKQVRTALLLLSATAATAYAQDATNTTTSTVISAIVLALILSGIFMVAFLVLRPRLPAIYQPKTYRSKPPSRNSEPLSKGIFSWVPQFLKTPDMEIYRVNGLDAYTFIMFLTLMIRIFVPIWIISWIVLMPLYAANVPNHGTGFFLFTFSNVINTSKQQQKRSAGVLILHYIMIAWILYNIHVMMRRFIKLRQDFLISPHHRNSNQAKTFLVTGVPNEVLSETKLKQIYGQVPGGVKKVWINRNLKGLPKMVEERDKLVIKLEKAVAKLIKKAAKNVKKGKAEAVDAPEGHSLSLDVAERYVPAKQRPTHRLGKIPCIGQKVDTITHSRQELRRLNDEIETMRQRVTNDYQEYPPRSSAFVLCNTMMGAHFAARAEAHPEPYRMAERYLEIHPKDVVWSNLNLNPYERKIRSVGFWVLTWATVIFWCIPIAIVSLFANFDFLKDKVFFLHWISAIKGIPRGIIKAVLPTAALAILNSLLPPWLRYLAKQSGIPTHNGIELSLFTRYFIFQVIQNFLFLTIVSGIQANATQFVDQFKDPAGFVATISGVIPKASTFFLEYVFLLGLSGAAGILLQIVPLILYYAKLFLLSSSPRTIWHLRNDMSAPAWGVLYGSTMLIVVLALSYMVLAPVMNGFASVTFFTYYLAYRYMFMYVYDCKPQNETAGLFFPRAISFTFVGIYVSTFVVALMYFFNSGANTAFVAMGVLTILLLVLIVGYHYFLMDSYGKLITALPLMLDQQAEMQHGGDVAPPALPEKDQYYAAADGTMVPARSQNHVLQMEDPSVDLEKKQIEEAKTINAFYHPSRLSEQMVLWYPNDNYGIGRSQVAADHGLGFESTTDKAFVNEKYKIDENAEVAPGEED